MYKELEYCAFIEPTVDIAGFIKRQEWYVETDIYVATWRDADDYGNVEGYEIYKVVN